MNFHGRELPVFRANLHTHSTVSDGWLTPQQVIDYYEQGGYEVLAFSDHYKANPVAQYRTRNMTLLPGIELHPKGPRGLTWHLLALGVPENFPGKYATAQRAIDAVHAAGGMVFVAHPHWCGITSADILKLKNIVGIEVYNSSTRYIGKASSEECWDELISAGFACGALAVDDIHGMSEAFGGWTMIVAPDRSPEALFDALRNRRYYATQGPEFHRLSFENGVFEADFSEAVEVCVVGRNDSGKVVCMPDYPFPGNRPVATHLRVEVTPRFGGVLRCRIRDDRGRQAWSAPITW